MRALAVLVAIVMAAPAVLAVDTPSIAIELARNTPTVNCSASSAPMP
jgi:hypothetical protein